VKSERQKTILQLVRTKDIFTQEELTAALTDAGFPAAQATISRDIRELRLTKEAAGRGQKYVTPLEPEHSLARIFRDGLVSVDHAGNMLVLRTLSGFAMAVALALDDMNFPEILGSIAGDDVVHSVVRTEADAARLVERLRPC